MHIYLSFKALRKRFLAIRRRESSGWLRSWGRGSGMLLALLLLLAGGAEGRAQTMATVTNSIMSLEGLLGSVPATQEFVYVGDMGFRPAYLQSWVRELRTMAGWPVTNAAAHGVAPKIAFDPRIAGWTGGVVPYTYDSSMTPGLITEFEGAIYIWQQEANLKFIARTTEANYIVVVNSGTGGPADSQVGMVGGGQIIHVNTDYPQIDFAHEIGHAMGALHEQSRSDRDTYVKIHWENFKTTIVNPQANVNFAILTNSINEGTYDYDSIMEYPPTDGNTARTNGCSDPDCTQIEPLEPYYSAQGSPPLGQTSHLSVRDKAGMGLRYGLPRTISGRVVNGLNGPFAGVVVHLSGGVSYRGPATVTTDTNGNYSFGAIPNNSGTFAVSATLPGHSLVPGGYNVTIGTTDSTSVNFSDADKSPPTVTIMAPTNTSYKTIPVVSGTAADSSGPADTGVAQVRVVLYRMADGIWWNFHDSAWGTTDFNAFYNLSVASGTTSWSANLPGTLADGGYEVQAQAVDNAANASGWVTRDFTMDRTGPTITFSPLTNQAVVFDLSALGGGVSKPATVQFSIDWYQAGGNLFWNGVNWTSVANDPGVLRGATVTGLNWTPGPGTLPPRQQLARANYVIHVYATDTAGNAGYSDLVLSRSAQDTTPPLITLDSIHSGDVITSPGLPGLTGLALDNESGIASVTVYLNRFTGGGVLYWDGTSWSGSAAGLPATYHAATAGWQVNAALPTGGNLPNADYQVQVSAQNNEAPGGVALLSVPFSVDYHPVYVFNYGSQFGLAPNMAWGDPANWDVGSVPTADARVVITNYSPNNTGLGSLSLYRLDLSGGTLTTSGMLITKLNVSGGTLAGGAIGLAANGIFNWSGGTLMGTYAVPAGATANLTGTADKTLNLATIVNNGTVVWNGGNLSASYGSGLTNNATFVLQSSGIIQNNFAYYGYGFPLPTFVNNGLFQKTVSNGQTVLSPDNGGWAFYQNGTIDIENGALISQNKFFANGGAVFTGPGETRVEAGSVTLNGPNTIQPGATVKLAGGSWYGNNTFTGPGTFVWSGGTIVENITIAAGANLAIVGEGAKKITGQLNNAGSGVWTGTGVVNCTFGSVINNSGTWLIQNDAMFYNNGDYYGYGFPLPTFNNSGSLIKTNSTGTTYFHFDNGGVAFNNHGSVMVQGGRLALGGGGVSQQASFKMAPGAEVDLNGGTHNFGAGLMFSGGLTRMLSGTLNFTGTNVLTNSAAFEIAGGSVTGANTFAGAGAMNWTGGTISAILNLQSNIALNISGTGDKQLYSGTVNSAGPGWWTGSGRVICSFGSIFQNSGTFTVENDALFFNDLTYYGYGLPQPVFINNGSVIKTNSTGTTCFPPDNTGIAFNNNGSVRIQSGNLVLGGGGISTNDSFAVASGSTVDFTNGNFSFSGNQTLSGAGTNRVSGAMVVFNNGTNTLGGGNTFAIVAGTINGTGTFAGTGPVNWSGGTISAILNLQSNIALNISGADDKRLYSGTVNSAGPGWWTGSGRVICSFGSIFQNSGAFTVQNDALFYNDLTYYGYGLPQPVFINNGSVIKTNSTGTTYFPPDNTGIAFNNNGSVRIQSGNLALGGGGMSTNDSFTVAAGSTVDFTNGTFAFDGSLALSGAGTTRVSGASVTFHNTATTMGGASTLEVAAGSITGNNSLSGGGAVRWSGGTISAIMTLQPAVAFNLTGPNNKILDMGTINSSGASSWTGTGNFNFGFGSLFNNSGTFTVQSDAMVYNDGAYYGYGYPAPVLLNTGTIRKNTTSGSTAFPADNGGVGFDNRGTVDLQTGSLAINSLYTSSGAPLLKLVLGGSLPGAQFSQEIFGSPASLGGNLMITLGSGFVPTNGQSFAIITYSSATGQFTAPQLPVLPIDLAWQVTYGNTAVTLNVVPSKIISQPTRLANGHFQFAFSAPNASAAIIEGSTNLLDWTSLQTNAPFTGSLLFDDPQAVSYPMRWYRVFLQP